MNSYSKLFDVEAPVALVTGSSAQRVGRTIAGSLADRGCTLALHGNTSIEEGKVYMEELESKGRTVEMFQANLKDEHSPVQLVRDVIDAFGRIDIVVNSAAIWYPTPLDSVSPSDIDHFMRINCTASFMVAKTAGLQMAKQSKGGVIVNIGDWATIRPYADYSAYFLSKGNLETMTRLLAVEMAQLHAGTRVNAVLPGPVMIPESMDAKLRSEIINATLLKREGSPQNVADACRCLIENDFITGACLPVDGGRSVYSPYNPV